MSKGEVVDREGLWKGNGAQPDCSLHAAHSYSFRWVNRFLAIFCTPSRADRGMSRYLFFMRRVYIKTMTSIKCHLGALPSQ